jgi:hypothetical protein
MYPSILSFETSLSCSLYAVFPGLNMWDTFALHCFDFKVRPRTPATNPGLLRQSNLKSPQTTCYWNFFIQLYSAIAVLATCPQTQGYRKKPLFHTKRSSGRNRESNPGHPVIWQSGAKSRIMLAPPSVYSLVLHMLLLCGRVLPVHPHKGGIG